MFTNLSTTPTAAQTNAGKRTKTFLIYGDFGASGQVQLQIQSAAGDWVSFSTLTWDENTERAITLPDRAWRINPVDCVSIDVDVV